MNRRGLGYERTIGDQAEGQEGQGEDRRRHVPEARHRAIMPGSGARHVTRLSAALTNDGKGPTYSGSASPFGSGKARLAAKPIAYAAKPTRAAA